MKAFEERFGVESDISTSEDWEVYIATRDGWRAAFEDIQQWLMGRRCTEEDVLDYIYKELNNE